jgi:hypothetical protein
MIQISRQEGQRSPVNFNLTKSIPRHLTIKFSKVKDETKESQDCKRKETNNTRGVSICLTADFSEEILQANRVAQGFHSIESLKKKKKTHCQLRILYCKNLSFRNETDEDVPKQKLKQFISNRHVLCKIIKDILHTERDINE